MLSFISYLPRKTPATKILKLSLVLPVPLKRIVLSDSTSTNMLPYEPQKGQRIKIVANDCNPNIENCAHKSTPDGHTQQRNTTKLVDVLRRTKSTAAPLNGKRNNNSQPQGFWIFQIKKFNIISNSNNLYKNRFLSS